MPEVKLTPGEHQLTNLLKSEGVISSTSEGRRFIKQGLLKIDGEKILDTEYKITINFGDTKTIKVGKRRFLKVSSTNE